MAGKKEELSGLEFVLAWGSFIPGLGLLLGIAAMVLGAIKLRAGGHKLILIALGGIVFSCMGSLLFVKQVLWPSFFSSKGIHGAVYQTLSKQRLKETVMALEYYHQVHGAYPDNLDLLKGDGVTYLNDVSGGIDMKNVRQLHFYELQPDGLHYRLLDAGPDGVTGTADDVDPLMGPEELARTGYFRP